MAVDRLSPREEEWAFAHAANDTIATTNPPKGVIVFSGDETKKDEVGKIFVDGKQYGGGGGDDKKFADGTEAPIQLGGISSDYDLAGKDAISVLDDLLHPEYAPYVIDATATISCNEPTPTQQDPNATTPIVTGKVVEVGTKTPKKAWYSKNGTPKMVIGKLGTYAAANGTPTTNFTQKLTAVATADTTDNAYDKTTTKPGKFTVTNTATCAVGQASSQTVGGKVVTTNIVKTNKGSATNKTAGSSDDRKLVTVAEVNTSDIQETADGSGMYVVNGTTKSQKHEIEYRYKVYAATQTNGTLTNQGLLNQLQVTLKGGNGAMCFALPASYTGVTIKEFNPDSGKYDIDGVYTESTTTYTDANGTNVTYKKYTRGKSQGEDTKILVTFTIA